MLPNKSLKLAEEKSGGTRKAEGREREREREGGSYNEYCSAHLSGGGGGGGSGEWVAFFLLIKIPAVFAARAVGLGAQEGGHGQGSRQPCIV